MRINLHEGFHLSPIRHGDQAAYIEHFRDRETVDNLLMVPYPYTEEEAEAWVTARVGDSVLREPETRFALRREDGFLVGGAGLMWHRESSAHRAEVGYWVARDYRRRGLASASVRGLIAHAFDNLGIKRLQATVFPANLASQGVLEKTGFQREGLLRSYVIKNGALRDAFIYGLVRLDLTSS